MRTPQARLRLQRWLFALGLLGTVLLGWLGARYVVRHRLPPPDAQAIAQAQRVRILRDSYGVPHIFGQSDGDAAFGLAWAHAEDDWPTIQAVLAASRGRLSLLQLSKQALLNDYYVQVIDVAGSADAQWQSIDPAVREVLESYARGLSLYAAVHPFEADARLLPFTGKDIAAGFIHKMPLLVGAAEALAAARKGPAAGDVISRAPGTEGSNAHALLPSRTSDDSTFLNINSHQPWEGPVAWYEAQVHSEQGWNMTGGLFPGSPVVLHGHNDHLGWAHTVNKPALVDLFALTVENERYRLDGKWLPLEQRRGTVAVDLGLFTLPVTMTFYRSVHGPVVHGGGRWTALRVAGSERSARTVEQWFRMGKATTLAEWKAAMALQAIPMFNVVYADSGNIFYLYNALLGRPRAAGVPRQVLPGDRSDAIPTRYLALEDLPQVLDPPAGFVQNCNTSPFRATEGDANAQPGKTVPADGIETTLDNRGMRSLQLLSPQRQLRLDLAEFTALKFDRAYAPGSDMFRLALEPLIAAVPQTEAERRGLALLRAWDGDTAPTSRTAALAILTFKPLTGDSRSADDPVLTDPLASFRRAAAWLVEHHGRVDPPLGEVQRLRRGATDLPLGGGPDVLAATYAKTDGAHLVGTQGDSFIQIVRFGKDGASSRSISPYGASNRSYSAHFADQAPLFARQELKPCWRTLEDLRAHLEREYTPATAR